MVELEFYAIHTTVNEYNDVMVEMFPSFEECLANRMKYENWYAAKGDIYIKHYKGGKTLEIVDTWHIRPDGSISGHWTF